MYTDTLSVVVVFISKSLTDNTMNEGSVFSQRHHDYIPKTSSATDITSKIRSSICRLSSYNRICAYLPGEIRNIVLRLALVQPEKIEVDGKGPGEPSLLRMFSSPRTPAHSECH